jgi:hypothetical protein
MKKTQLTFVLFCIVLTANSQAVLDHVYTGKQVNAVELQNYGWCYYAISFNPPYPTVEIYDEGDNLLKTIQLFFPTNTIFAGIDNVSDVLFNSDTKIEVLYSVMTHPGEQFQSILINEDGLVLQTFPGISGSMFVDMNGAFKMISTSYSDSSTYIYNLPGTMLNVPVKTNNMLTNTFPNPCSDYIFLSTPANSVFLTIRSTDGNQLYSSACQGNENKRVNTKSFSPGLYIYQITLNNGEKINGKFIVGMH